MRRLFLLLPQPLPQSLTATRLSLSRRHRLATDGRTTAFACSHSVTVFVTTTSRNKSRNSAAAQAERLVERTHH
jgi:hypothetical protein